ncbi:MAG: L-lactate dehydrogenase [Epsilonproteobacteria bacterium]|nr:L-lactate dehydrogenase [Campylobacterota bacterium]
MQKPVIAIIGAGAVGSTAAYALMYTLSAEIVLIDLNEHKCNGEVQDLEDAGSMSDGSTIRAGTIGDARQADIVVITAGIAQKPGQTRLELLKTNYEIVGSIMQSMHPIKKSTIIIVVTNPVDILTRYVQEISGLPNNQVFGSGTFLDTQRLRCSLAEHFSINPSSIHAYVLGEHGDTQFVPWSTAMIGTAPLCSFSIDEQALAAMAHKAQRKAYEIISCKGFTSFGIASAVATYCEAIIGDTKRVIPLSCFIEELSVCLSMPAVLGLRGIEQIVRPPFNAQEQEKLCASVQVVREQYAEVTQKI